MSDAGLDSFFRLMNANGAARVYHYALESGVLDALARQPHTPASLAALQKLHPRPTGFLLHTLGALGLTEPTADDPEAHALTPLARRLVASPYRNLGDAYWDHLPRFLESNEPCARMDDPAAGAAHYAAQAESLAWMFSEAAPIAAGLIAARCVPAPTHILDLGAGSAVWSLTLARALPGATVTAVDWPQVLNVAGAFAGRLGLAERFRALPGDYHHLALPPADLVLLANVTHLEPADGLRSLLARIRAVLSPGGRLAIIDVLPDPGSPTAALYALGLALRTQAAQPHSLQSLVTFLGEAGFDPPQVFPLDAPPHALSLLFTKAARSP
jgi:SAM-dependent methyltransferase